jgi:hypothetical protein
VLWFAAIFRHYAPFKRQVLSLFCSATIILHTMLEGLRVLSPVKGPKGKDSNEFKHSELNSYALFQVSLPAP